MFALWLVQEQDRPNVLNHVNWKIKQSNAFH